MLRAWAFGHTEEKSSVCLNVLSFFPLGSFSHSFSLFFVECGDNIFGVLPVSEVFGTSGWIFDIQAQDLLLLCKTLK